MARRSWYFILLGLVLFPCIGRAETASYIVISQVQTTGGTGKTDNDFIELYNPTENSFDLKGYRLVKRTASATSDSTIKSWTDSAIVPAHGYFLWANKNFTSIAIAPDESTSETISDNNWVAIRKGDANIGEIIDSLAWGVIKGATTPIESVPYSSNPSANQSLKRKPGNGQGNGEDTNNNAQDFVLDAQPSLRNTKNAAEPALQSTPPATLPVTTPTNPSVKPADIIINEFVSYPESGNEWVELYNTAINPVDVTGWKLKDGTGSVMVTLTGSLGIDAIGKYKVVEIPSAKLNNDGDRVVLETSAGIIIDAVSYSNWDDGNTSDNALRSDKGQSIARKSNGIDSDNDKIDFAVSDEVTRGLPNIIKQTQTSGSGTTPLQRKPANMNPVIKINEFVADPTDGETEWIELYNAGEVSVDIAGWTIEEGRNKKTLLSGTIMPGAFVVVQPVNGQLMNAGDIIILRDATNIMMDKVVYGIWDDGNRVDNALSVGNPASISRKQDGVDTGKDSVDFIIATSLTKGKTNQLSDVDKNEIPDNAVIFSEIVPSVDGGGRKEEFIELKNVSKYPVNISGWFLKKDEGRMYVIQHAIMEPNGFFVLWRAENGLALGKLSDHINLYDMHGHLKDKVAYDDAQNNMAYILANNAWHWTARDTPNSENILQKPLGFAYSALKIPSEVPLGARVVLNGLENINTDGSKLAFEWHCGQEIKTGERVECALGSPGNKTIELTVRSALGAEIKKSQVIKVASIARVQTAHATKNTKNVQQTKVSASKNKKNVVLAIKPLSIADARVQDVGTVVVVRGALTVLPNILGKNILYLDDGAGIQLFIRKGQAPAMNVGDVIEVAGSISELQGERRVLTDASAIKIIEHKTAPQPRAVSSDDFDDALVGSVVTLTGTVTDRRAGNIYIDDGAGETRVYVGRNVGFDTTRVNQGSKIEVAGIVSMNKSGIRILPRNADDVRLVVDDQTNIPEQTQIAANQDAQSARKYLLTTIAGAGSVLVGLGLRKKIKIPWRTRFKKLIFWKKKQAVVTVFEHDPPEPPQSSQQV